MLVTVEQLNEHSHNHPAASLVSSRIEGYTYQDRLVVKIELAHAPPITVVKGRWWIQWRSQVLFLSNWALGVMTIKTWILGATSVTPSALTTCLPREGDYLHGFTPNDFGVSLIESSFENFFPHDDKLFISHNICCDTTTWDVAYCFNSTYGHHTDHLFSEIKNESPS